MSLQIVQPSHYGRLSVHSFSGRRISRWLPGRGWQQPVAIDDGNALGHQYRTSAALAIYSCALPIKL